MNHRTGAVAVGNLRAVIYVNRANSATATRRCLNHCDDHGYAVTSVVIEGENTECWRDAFGAVAAGLADVIVVADRDTATGGLPLEVAGQNSTRNRTPDAGQRRPHRTG